MSEEKIGHTGIFVFQQLTLILLSGNLTLQVSVKFLFKKTKYSQIIVIIVTVFVVNAVVVVVVFRDFFRLQPMQEELIKLMLL